MKVQEIKSFCKVCGSLFDNGRLRNCNYCKCKLVKVNVFAQTFSGLNNVYTLRLNFQYQKGDTDE